MVTAVLSPTYFSHRKPKTPEAPIPSRQRTVPQQEFPRSTYAASAVVIKVLQETQENMFRAAATTHSECGQVTTITFQHIHMLIRLYNPAIHD